MLDNRRGWAVTTGTQGSVVRRTSDGGKTWQDRTPPGFVELAPDLGNGDVFAASFGLSVLSDQRLWIAFSSRFHDQDALVVERTGDGGQHWRRATFAGAAESTALQFLDVKHGFLLASGSPAAGLMRKDVYESSDGGRTWTRKGSPDLIGCNYYPTGMTFRNTREGWITGTNHGDPPAPLFRTRDGGRTWQVQPVPLPAPYADGYANTYRPRFSGKNGKRGAFTAYLVNNGTNQRQSANYLTHDGGEHWRVAPMRSTTL